MLKYELCDLPFSFLAPFYPRLGAHTEDYLSDRLDGASNRSNGDRVSHVFENARGGICKMKLSSGKE